MIAMPSVSRPKARATFRFLTITVSPRPRNSELPEKATLASPDTLTSGSIVSASSCPCPPENSKIPFPVTFALASRCSFPALTTIVGKAYILCEETSGEENSYP